MYRYDNYKAFRLLCSYQQALSSVVVGQKKLEELGVPIKRPDDYFAEMLKTDDHMRKVSIQQCSLCRVQEFYTVCSCVWCT